MNARVPPSSRKTIQAFHSPQCAGGNPKTRFFLPAATAILSFFVAAFPASDQSFAQSTELCTYGPFVGDHSNSLIEFTISTTTCVVVIDTSLTLCCDNPPHSTNCCSWDILNSAMDPLNIGPGPFPCGQQHPKNYCFQLDPGTYYFSLDVCEGGEFYILCDQSGSTCCQ